MGMVLANHIHKKKKEIALNVLDLIHYDLFMASQRSMLSWAFMVK